MDAKSKAVALQYLRTRVNYDVMRGHIKEDYDSRLNSLQLGTDKMIQKIINKDGLIHQAVDKEGVLYYVLDKKAEEVSAENPAFALNAQTGEIEQVGAVPFDEISLYSIRDFEALMFDTATASLKQGMDAEEQIAEQTAQQAAQEEQIVANAEKSGIAPGTVVDYKGQQLTVSYVDNNGIHLEDQQQQPVVVPLSEQGKLKSVEAEAQPEETAPEQTGAVASAPATQQEAQQPQSWTIGKKTFAMQQQEDGSTFIPFEAGKDETKTVAAEVDDTQFDVVPVTEEVPLQGVPAFAKKKTQTVVKGVRIVPKQTPNEQPIATGATIAPQSATAVAGTPEAGAVAPEAGAEPEKRSFTDLTEKQKKRPKRRTGAQRKVEDMEFDGDPVGFAMQFMSNMGDLHMSAIEELFTTIRNRVKVVSPGELAARTFWVNRKGGGMTIDQIAHHLWESQPEGMDVPSDEYRNIVADIIIGHKTPAGIARALIERGVKAVGKGENMEQNEDFANFLAQEEKRQEALFDEVFALTMQELERTGKLITDEEYLSLFLQDDNSIYYDEGTSTSGTAGASGQAIGNDGNEQGRSSRNDEGAVDPQSENGNEAEAGSGAGDEPGDEKGSGIAPQPVFEIDGKWFNFAEHTPGKWWLYQYYEDRWQPIPNTADEIREQEIASQHLANLPDGYELIPPFETEQAEEQPKANTVIDHITAAEINDQAAQADPNPTDAQKEAGNYQHGHTKVQGFDISIENAAGSIRSGRDSDGEEWMVEMQNHYGYFTRTEGKDGDQVDCFIGENPETGKIFIVDQINPETGEFDEHKVMIGFDSLQEAAYDYNENYSYGWKGLGAITEMPLDEFKVWLKDGTRTKEPVAYGKESLSDAENTENQGEAQAENPAIEKQPTAEEFKPIRELGTGANVYFDQNGIRVNESIAGGYVLSVSTRMGDQYLTSVRFDNIKEAMYIADRLNKTYPNGVPSAVLIDNVIEGWMTEASAQPSNRSEKPTGSKQPWEMTREEYEYNPKMAAHGIQISHRFIVKQALSEGRPVPAEVLADYPELQKQSKAEQPEQSNDIGKAISASSRFRPYETIVFDNPIEGANGNKLVSYPWAYECPE
ncbi:MAG: hypothetical protein EOM15_07595, partial [Spirochaetia bacterium]|nr:hypothetical protein [Spirochaetia bacterium]